MSYLFNQPSKYRRTGKQDRVNTDRFFNIMNEGWFLYLRKDQVLLENIKYTNGVAGPFPTKLIARDYLNSLAHTRTLSALEPSDGSTKDSNEDWRY